MPYYRKYFVDPFLPYIPAKLNPNTITHAGHLVNLAATAMLVALWPRRGLVLVAGAIALQFYLWCDNADGAHARRTKQCSAFGEFLDHGLDQLNTVYIGYLTALALGASPTWWVVISLIIPGAACLTYWEQSHTGVFRLGLLNQVESLSLLTGVLVLDGMLGMDVMTEPRFFGISISLGFFMWIAATILFGMARNIVRVAAHAGARSAALIFPVLFFGASIFGAARVGAISTIVAVTLATCGNVYFGMRMLSRRLQGARERVDVSPAIFGGVLSALIAWQVTGHTVEPEMGIVVALAACAVFGLKAAKAAHASAQHLARVDQAAIR